MNRSKVLDCFCSIILIIGGLNWALVGIFNFNFVSWIFSAAPIFARITYILVGLAALWQLIRFKCTKNC
ncbi:MAG: hypothetical protein S4CHLAM7_13310 [Chlamydiae bacterium]|nr:hypothetical protein [Chlamydiota bacterium]